MQAINPFIQHYQPTNDDDEEQWILPHHLIKKKLIDDVINKRKRNKLIDIQSKNNIKFKKGKFLNPERVLVDGSDYFWLHKHEFFSGAIFLSSLSSSVRIMIIIFLLLKKFLFFYHHHNHRRHRHRHSFIHWMDSKKKNFQMDGCFFLFGGILPHWWFIIKNFIFLLLFGNDRVILLMF